MTKRRSWLEAFWRAVRGLFTGKPRGWDGYGPEVIRDPEIIKARARR